MYVHMYICTYILFCCSGRLGKQSQVNACVILSLLSLVAKEEQILQAHSHWPVSPARGTYSGCYNPCSVVLSWGYVSPARGTDSGCYNTCSIIRRCGVDLVVQTKVGLQLPRPRYFGRGRAHAPCEVWLRSCVFLPRTK